MLRISLHLCRAYSRNSTAAFQRVKSVTSVEVPNQNLSSDWPFSSAQVGCFVQESPRLENQYTQDTLLRSFLRRHVPSKHLPEIEADLDQFGHRVATDIYDLHLRCEREPPVVEQTNAWGHRVDCLVTSTAWRDMHHLSAQEGLVALAYERKFGAVSRLYQVSKLYLYSPSSGLYSCPLAMADGAAKIIETNQSSAPWLVDRALVRLTSRDPASFWTSGQWMTEKRGGSDVANGTETVAVPQQDGTYCLYGYKWFSSATDANMTFALARVVDHKGDVKEVSEEGRGVAGISNMLTITRLHNSISAAAAMRRLVSLARDYSTRRQAFGSLLIDHPLHVQTLARMEVETRGAALLVLEMGRLLGREETGEGSETESHMLRLLVPVMKLYTAKQAVAVSSEGLECFGGQGYIEDTGLPSILRDAQVLTIWEGTTNVLSLDVLRAVSKSKGSVLHAFESYVNSHLQLARECRELDQASDRVRKGVQGILRFAASNPTQLGVAARDFAFSIARVAIGSLLIDHAASSVGTDQDVFAAQRWCEKDLTPVLTAADTAYSPQTVAAERHLVFADYPQQL